MSVDDGRFVNPVRVTPLLVLRQIVRSADAPTIRRLQNMVCLALHNRWIMESAYYNTLRHQRRNIDVILDQRQSLRAKKKILQKGGFLSLPPVLDSLATNAIGPVISLFRNKRR